MGVDLSHRTAGRPANCESLRRRTGKAAYRGIGIKTEPIQQVTSPMQATLFVVYRILFVGLGFVLFAPQSPCQQTSTSDPAQPGIVRSTQNNDPPPAESRRILGIVPNYRTSPSLQNYQPL